MVVAWLLASCSIEMARTDETAFLGALEQMYTKDQPIRVAFKRLEEKDAVEFAVLVRAKQGSVRCSTIVLPDRITEFAEKYSELCRNNMQLAKKQRKKQ